MKRKALCILCILAVLLLLSGCSGEKEVFEEYGAVPTVTAITQTQFTAENASAAVSGSASGIMDANPYDEWASGETGDDYAQQALNEEGFSDPEDTSFYNSPEDSYAVEETPTPTPYLYAGTTPILLDPIDKPTPTPKAQFSLSYTDYISTNLGLKFKVPSGWTVDESQSQLCVISEPVVSIKDGQQCIITLSAQPLNETYSEKDLTTLVKQCLNDKYTGDIQSFSPSLTATRSVLGKKGVYANYSAVKNDGTEIGGRIMYVSVNNKLYGLEIVYPYGFKSSYEPAFGEVRSSLATSW